MNTEEQIPGILPMTTDMMAAVKGNRSMPCSVRPPGMIKLADLDVEKLRLSDKEYKLTQYNQTNQYLQYDYSKHSVQLPKRIFTSSGISNYQEGTSFSMQLDFKSVDGKKWMENGIVSATDPVEGKAFQKFVDIDRKGRALANIDENKKSWIWFSFIKCTNKKNMLTGEFIDGEYWPPSVKLNIKRDYTTNKLEATCIDGIAVKKNYDTIKRGETSGCDPEREFCEPTEVIAKSLVLAVFTFEKIYKRVKSAPMSSEAGMHLMLNRCTFWRPEEIIDDRRLFFSEENLSENGSEKEDNEDDEETGSVIETDNLDR